MIYGFDEVTIKRNRNKGIISKPKTEAKSKKGIDAALDGLE